MDRRSMFKAVMGVAAAAGATVSRVSSVAAAERPALAVLEVDGGSFHPDAMEAAVKKWKGTPFGDVPLLVMNGARLTLLDAEGRVINRLIGEEG